MSTTATGHLPLIAPVCTALVDCAPPDNTETAVHKSVFHVFLYSAGSLEEVSKTKTTSCLKQDAPACCMIAVLVACAACVAQQRTQCRSVALYPANMSRGDATASAVTAATACCL
jgi:hypothetical protein